MTPITTLRIDPREAVSTLNGTSGKKNYFFVDLRSGADHDGILATGVAADGRSWKSPVLIEGIVNGLRELKKNVGEEAGCEA